MKLPFQTRSLLLYLGAWTPLAGLQALMLYAAGFGWRETAAVGLPLGFLYAFPCLSSWYLSQSLPLKRTRPLRVGVTFLAAAMLSSSYWILIGGLWTRLLQRLPDFENLAQRYQQQQTLLFLVGLLLYLLVAAAHYLALALEESSEAESRALQARLTAQQAELEALKFRINPHFLFNSLNSVSALISSNPERARRMCLLLAAFLRRSLRLGIEERISLSLEAGLMREYLEIERIRRPSLEFSIALAPRTEKLRVPALILQPLVENAVKHGVSQLLEGGEVRVSARSNEGRLRIAVENPYDPEAKRGRGTGLGLQAVEKRLEHAYGEEGRLRIRKEDGRFRVELSLPVEEVAP